MFHWQAVEKGSNFTPKMHPDLLGSLPIPPDTTSRNEGPILREKRVKREGKGRRGLASFVCTGPPVV